MIKKARKGRILALVRETAKGLHQAGVISTRRMHEYDDLCHPGASASSTRGKSNPAQPSKHRRSG